jgi:hypothetical protein
MMLLFCDRLVKYSGWFWGYISPIQERQALPIIPNPAVESSAESKLLVFRLKAVTPLALDFFQRHCEFPGL